ncbi:leucine-rich repeat domain-containing protein [Streptomyces sp. NPDC096132]|uniref:leucine-rich repeat domain-containing protein n=1 Tax=Streptomyces sp. NPDC096132 TaxID=3366075 RepID=UPI003812ACEA
MTKGGEPQASGSPGRDWCGCLAPSSEVPTAADMRLHTERQDTSAPGWQRLLALVEEAAADGREEFRPLAELTAEERRQVVTLPPTIAKLKAVRHLMLYGSNLVRIPPEIGEMESLEEFTPYTSYRLHWFPYEVTRCANLRRSTVSTRALYGNFKTRVPFPSLRPPVPQAETAGACSVCAGALPASGPEQVWVSLPVATDVLPLLVNACSQDCVDALPQPAAHHVPTAHRGGPSVVQPPAR